MSYARSPRPVCSMTIGTSIVWSSFQVLPHSRPNNDRLGGGGSKIAAFTRTGDTRNRGFSRRGFYLGFYPALHPVSIERGRLPWSVATVLLPLQFPFPLPRRSPQFSLLPRSFPAAAPLLRPVPPGLFVRCEGGQSPFS